ncbi:nitroreductase/quinone reductase family protein [Actinoplanes sp. NPDC051859]|uniref:nitroreductase/quinone reductase family protein n=1 Tax=Actinoplanes sp. NPDC051859 TaxID=3363909 RepID=UPI00379B1D52
MPPDIALKAMNAAHRTLLKLSCGRLGWQVASMTVLELVTTGRRSGVPRAVMLTSPLTDGDALVIVASRGGDDRHPAWFLNLRDRPEVQVSVRGGSHQPMVARIASAEEHARLWPQVVKVYRSYAAYQKRTTREIPLVLLSPA